MKWSTATDLPIFLGQEGPFVMTPSASTFLHLGAAGLGLVTLAHVVALVTLLRRPRAANQARPGISILKPLKGAELGLEENLVAVLSQDHPTFEVLFAAEDADDPALVVARRLCERFSQVRTQVVVGTIHEGLNPKVRLLRALEPHATHPFLLISDSNVRPRPNYLREVQDAQLAADAALVHSLLGPTASEAFADGLEQIHLASWVVPTVSLTSLFRHPVVIGKSMLLRRSTLAKIGGFEAVRDVLAEDHILGRRLAHAGERVVLSPHVLPVSSAGRGLRGFWNRYVRWNQMQKTIAPPAFVGTLVVQSVPYLALAAALGGVHERTMALGLLLLKMAIDLVFLRLLGGRLSFGLLPAWVLRELLFAPMWLASLFTRTVSWRGRRFVVSRGSHLRPAAD